MIRYCIGALMTGVFCGGVGFILSLAMPLWVAMLIAATCFSIELICITLDYLDHTNRSRFP